MSDEGAPFQWAITDHVGRCCFGRVLMRKTFEGRKLWRCSNCGTEREGASAASICACGIKMRGSVDMGIRCVPNASRTPDCLSEIVAQSVDAPKQSSAAGR